MNEEIEQALLLDRPCVKCGDQSTFVYVVTTVSTFGCIHVCTPCKIELETAPGVEPGIREFYEKPPKDEIKEEKPNAIFIPPQTSE